MLLLLLLLFLFSLLLFLLLLLLLLLSSSLLLHLRHNLSIEVSVYISLIIPFITTVVKELLYQSSADVYKQGAGNLKPDMFVSMFKDNFVGSATQFGHINYYNNHVNNGAKASKEWDNNCEITISDVELIISRLNRTAAQNCSQLTIMYILHFICSSCIDYDVEIAAQFYANITLSKLY